MPDPVINAGNPGADLNWTQTLAEEFNLSDGPYQARSTSFKFIDMDTDGGLHKVGNKDIDANGNSAPGSSVRGKRWSAWYNDHQDQCTYIKGNELVMGGFAVNDPDPTRVQYDDNGTQVNYDEWRFYTSFLVTWDREYSNAANGGAGGHIEASDSPGILFGPGSCIEFRASFEEMRARSFRWSFYLLPEQYDESNLAYDADVANGAEVDAPEFDATPGFLGHLQQKVIGGQAGQTPSGSVDVMGGFGINPSVGYHTHTLLWLDNMLVWYVDGVETQRDETLVMQSRHYVVFSREINSGVNEIDLHHNPPYVPVDNGIFGQNFWHDRNRLITPTGDGDVARISYFRGWTSGGQVTPPSGDIAGRLQDPVIGSVVQRIPLLWRSNDPNFDYDNHTYEWIHNAPSSTNPVLIGGDTREAILEFSGTLADKVNVTYSCKVLKKEPTFSG